MSRYQVRPKEDGRGPYRWIHVVKSGHGGLRQGTIHHILGDELNVNEVCNSFPYVTKRALKCAGSHDPPP